MKMRISEWKTACLMTLMLAAVSGPLQAQSDFEREPVNYSEATPTDAIAQLQQQLDSGAASLEYDKQHGYLKSVLDRLGISQSSQVLVFSRTSFQRDRIAPETPRALYFNDDVYIGWVQRGDVIEVSAVDQDLGAVFYTLDQEQTTQPKFVRQTDHCLSCHASAHTRRVPGHMVRSVFPDHKGLPVLSAGTYRSDHTSPLEERWGGWYVTGTHGKERHMGNVLVESRRDPENLDRESGANVSDLNPHFRTAPYLTGHSDIVALMVLEHQVAMHNRITEATFSGKFTTRDADVMNKALERPEGFQSESTKRRYKSAASKVLDCLLLKKEYQLKDEIKGSTAYADDFAKAGPFDSQGRSLRQLDLKTRLFRYPCSFLIYSDAFDALPDEVKQLVYRNLWNVLTSTNTDDEYPHLSVNDRVAIREILQETKQGLPSYWGS